MSFMKLNTKISGQFKKKNNIFFESIVKLFFTYSYGKHEDLQ